MKNIIYKSLPDGIKLFKYQNFADHRGDFKVIFEAGYFSDYDFVQDNFVYTKEKHTLRGIHYQIYPYSQAKLITVIDGEILDVIIDLRKESDSYLKVFQFYIGSEDYNQILIPRGFAHGYLTLSNDVTIHYKVDNNYSVTHERIINYLDPRFNISWPTKSVIVSDKDSSAKFLNINFMELL